MIKKYRYLSFICCVFIHFCVCGSGEDEKVFPLYEKIISGKGISPSTTAYDFDQMTYVEPYQKSPVHSPVHSLRREKNITRFLTTAPLDNSKLDELKVFFQNIFDENAFFGRITPQMQKVIQEITKSSKTLLLFNKILETRTGDVSRIQQIIQPALDFFDSINKKHLGDKYFYALGDRDYFLKVLAYNEMVFDEDFGESVKIEFADKLIELDEIDHGAAGYIWILKTPMRSVFKVDALKKLYALPQSYGLDFIEGLEKDSVEYKIITFLYQENTNGLLDLALHATTPQYYKFFMATHFLTKYASPAKAKDIYFDILRTSTTDYNTRDGILGLLAVAADEEKMIEILQERSNRSHHTCCWLGFLKSISKRQFGIKNHIGIEFEEK